MAVSLDAKARAQGHTLRAMSASANLRVNRTTLADFAFSAQPVPKATTLRFVVCESQPARWVPSISRSASAEYEMVLIECGASRRSCGSSVGAHIGHPRCYRRMQLLEVYPGSDLYLTRAVGIVLAVGVGEPAEAGRCSQRGSTERVGFIVDARMFWWFITLNTSARNSRRRLSKCGASKKKFFAQARVH